MITLWSLFPPPLAKILFLQGHHCKALTAPECIWWFWNLVLSYKLQVRTFPSLPPEATRLFCKVIPQTSYLCATSLIKTEFLILRSLWVIEQSFDPVRNPQSKLFYMHPILDEWGSNYLIFVSVSKSMTVNFPSESPANKRVPSLLNFILLIQ